MIIRGIDLSLTAPGICTSPARAESLRLDAKTGDRRLCEIRDWLIYHVHGHHVDLAVVEAVPPYAEATSSLERVHGVAREVLARYGVPVAYVSPSALKLYATGDGKADKQAMIDAAAIRTHDGGWVPADDNQADAWHLHRMGRHATQPQNWDMDAHQLRAMSSVAWPLTIQSDDGAIQPYGPSRQRVVVRKCGDRVQAMRNGDQWIHPFSMAVCTKPPK